MSDLFDDAQELEQMHRELAIKAARNYKRHSYTGHCLSCNEIITQGRFCDTECREHFELEQKMKRIIGKNR